MFERKKLEKEGRGTVDHTHELGKGNQHTNAEATTTMTPQQGSRT